MEIKVDTNYIEQAQIFATRKMAGSSTKKLLYHDITYIHRIVDGVKEIMSSEKLDDSDTEMLLMAAWLLPLGFTDLDKFEAEGDPKTFFLNCNMCSIDIANRFLESIDYPHARKTKVLQLIEKMVPEAVVRSLSEQILQDAITIDWGKRKSKKAIEKLYLELLLTNNLKVGKGSWLASAIDYLNGHQYYTQYAIENFSPNKDSLILKLEKELKDLGKVEKLAIKQELGISDEELKALKKSLKSVKGRDERGIQTMFRNTSKNHYTLNQMVDRKANIFISVNAIILSLILSRIVGTIDTWCIHNSPLLLILIATMVSIAFSIIAIIPTKTHGSFSEEEVRNKQGNLLYFGNYHSMAYRDYEWGILQMLNDSDYLYSSMIKDQYFLGKQLSAKHRLIRIALGSFLFGFLIAAILFFIVSLSPDFHFGDGAHQ